MNTRRIVASIAAGLVAAALLLTGTTAASAPTADSGWGRTTTIDNAPLDSGWGPT